MKALIKFITEEWYFFLPMVLMSLIAVALVVWRWLLNLNARTNLECGPRRKRHSANLLLSDAAQHHRRRDGDLRIRLGSPQCLL